MYMGLSGALSCELSGAGAWGSSCAAVEQAKAMAPLGVSVVEGPDGRPYWRKRRHPLFAATGMMLLTEIINARHAPPHAHLLGMQASALT